MRNELRTLMDVHKLSQAQVATQINKSTAVVNQYLQGKYRGDVGSIDKAVEQLIERYRIKQNEVKTGFVLTPSAKRILEVCDLTHSLGDIQLVIGEAGLGKTMALKQYAVSHADVVLIEVEPTFNAKVLLSVLCSALNITPGRNNHEMMLAIINKLKGSERLLIVDEAELLQYKPLEILRRIHDMAGIGIVLAGMPRLRANLRGARGEYKQLYSRVGFCYDLQARLSEDDMASLSEALLGTPKFNKRLYDVADGNARRLSKLARGVMRMSEIHQEPVNEEMIDRFAEMLIS